MIEDFLSSTDINAEEMIGGPSEELEGFPGLHSRGLVITWYIGSLFWGFPVSES